MTIDQVRFKLQLVYDRCKIDFKQPKAISIYPEGESESERPFVVIEYTDESHRGEIEKVDYDYFVN